MKFTKPEIAKFLSITSNVMASKGELLQFFRSPQFHPEDENEANHVMDFLTFRKQLDADLLDDNWMEKFLKGKTFVPSKIPVKVQKRLEQEQRDLEEYIKNLGEFLE